MFLFAVKLFLFVPAGSMLSPVGWRALPLSLGPAGEAASCQLPAAASGHALLGQLLPRCCPLEE